MQVFTRTALTGGAAGALDEESVGNLVEGDRAWVFDSSAQVIRRYRFYADDTDAESSPDVIRPDDYVDGGVWKLSNPARDIVGRLPSGVVLNETIHGFDYSMNSSDSTNDIDIAPGMCMDSSGQYSISTDTGLTKQLDVAFSAGDDAGGMLGGETIADYAAQTYKFMRVYALRKDADASVDFGFLWADDAISGNLPAGYSYYRKLGILPIHSTPEICQFYMAGDMIVFGKASQRIIRSVVFGAYPVPEPLASVYPASDVKGIWLGAQGLNTNAVYALAYGNVATCQNTQTDTDAYVWGATANAKHQFSPYPFSTITGVPSTAGIETSGTGYILCHGLILKR